MCQELHGMSVHGQTAHAGDVQVASIVQVFYVSMDYYLNISTHRLHQTCIAVVVAGNRCLENLFYDFFQNCIIILFLKYLSLIYCLLLISPLY